MARTSTTSAHLVRIGAEERAPAHRRRPAHRPAAPRAARRPRRARRGSSDAVAPGSPDLGVMLPYTPLHHLLLGLPGDPPGPRLLVMTSGNVAGEPIVTDDDEALDAAGAPGRRLAHPRPADPRARATTPWCASCDGEPLLVRRSRGYAPAAGRPARCPVRPALAVGGDLKNAFCLGEGRQRLAVRAHRRHGRPGHAARPSSAPRRSWRRSPGCGPRLLAADRHPGYRSARWAAAARRRAGRVVRVQHHHAHIASAMAEHGLRRQPPGDRRRLRRHRLRRRRRRLGRRDPARRLRRLPRFGHLAYVPLPGGDAAVRRPVPDGAGPSARGGHRLGRRPALRGRLPAGRTDGCWHGSWSAI